MRFAMFLLLVMSSQIAANDEVPPASAQDHWAWKAVATAVPPSVENVASILSPIDAFILTRLQRSRLEPTKPASREQLIRRISFDLIGLPPSPQEIEQYLNDDSPDAWEKVVDRLLASPHHGERWGRHWLDLARYADSNGFEFDEVRPDAWRYRDYVIESFNCNKPYTQFLREQISGDEIAPDDPSALIATGFNLLGPDMTDASDQIQRRQNTLNDMTDTTGLVFLALTIGCARCHDHKFEPFPQVDYYRLQAFFTPVKFRHNINIVPMDQRATLNEVVAKYEAERKPIQTALSDLERPWKTQLRSAKLAKQTEEVRAGTRKA